MSDGAHDGIIFNPLDVEDDGNNVYPTSLRTKKDYNHLTSTTPDVVHFIGMDFKEVPQQNLECELSEFILKFPFFPSVPCIYPNSDHKKI